MKYLLTLLFGLSFQPVLAQLIGPIPSTSASISQNSVSNLAVYGDTVWIGPQLQRNIGNTNDWFFSEALDSIRNSNARVYSLALREDTIFAGLGSTSTLDGQSIDQGFGFYLSTDGGDSWQFIEFGLEDEADNTFVYGASTLTKLPVIVPQQSPPYSVAIKGNVQFAAAWASGLKRSLDGGLTFERLLLPTSRLDSLVPELNYTFEFNPRNDNNFLGFSVFIDSQNRVWLGSAGGINWSPDALTADKSRVRWYRSAFNSAIRKSLPGNWVIFITEQPGTNRIWMTNWIANSGENYAISYTDDLGKTFQSFLIGEKIYGIDFYGDTIVAVGDNGIFISDDDGRSWNQIQAIRSANAVISPNANFFSVGASKERVWIGSTEGLVSTTDFQSFSITRVNLPLRGGNDFSPDAKSVSSYVYPNPFSISRHSYARFVFESEAASGQAKVTLYDFSMQKITEIRGAINGSGQYEAIWNGLDGKGRIVANGVVFYTIEQGGKKVNGKLLVMD